MLRLAIMLGTHQSVVSDEGSRTGIPAGEGRPLKEVHLN
jgi:hypothetical protein